MKEGRFRQDLFYRLNVLPIKLPPLRERTADIPRIVHHELKRQAAAHGAELRLSDCALQRLMAHDWPGNVRELINCIERLAVLFAGQTVTATELAEHLHLEPAPVSTAPLAAQRAFAPSTAAGIDLRQAVNDFEAALIRDAMAQSGGVLRRAARLLNVPRSTLAEKLARLEAQAPKLSSSTSRIPNEFDEEVPDLGRSGGNPHGFAGHLAAMGTEGPAAFRGHRGWASALPA
jgi:sigma-54 specific flagellar transcriptional regulator A